MLWCANFYKSRPINKVPARAAVVVLHTHLLDTTYLDIGNNDTKYAVRRMRAPSSARLRGFPRFYNHKQCSYFKHGTSLAVICTVCTYWTTSTGTDCQQKFARSNDKTKRHTRKSESPKVELKKDIPHGKTESESANDKKESSRDKRNSQRHYLMNNIMT